MKLIKILDVFYNNNFYSVYWYEKNIKNGYLKIEDNKIVFYSSRVFDEENVKLFLSNNIHKMIIRLKNSNNLFSFSGQEPWFSIDNKTILIKKTNQIKEKYKIYNNVLYIKTKNLDEKVIKKTISEIAYLKIDKIFKTSLKITNKQAEMSLKWSTSRWGYCYSPSKRIILNPKLIFFSDQQIQAVCIHEIAHLTYPYHNKDFYTYIDKFSKNYKILKERLDKYEFFKI